MYFLMQKIIFHLVVLVAIPKGLCGFGKEGELASIEEKPKYNFFVNTRLYIVEPKILKLITNNVKFDMT